MDCDRTMANKTLHIPPADEPMWEAAQRIATQRKTSLYRVIAEALEDYLPRAADRQTRWAHIAPDTAA